MSARRRLFTSESVTEGHPDKLCDQISDAVLDAIIKDDPKARVACETLATTGLVVVAGEITTTTYAPIADIVRGCVRSIGYTHADYGLDSDSCGVVVTIDRQSPDIAMGVNEESSKEQGAGDQGLMFGFACDETPDLMPLPIDLAHRITRQLSHTRKNGDIAWLRPDGKSQVTVEYEGDKPVRIDAVVVSTQHEPTVGPEEIRATIIEQVVKPVVPAELLDKDTKFHINPTGRFVIGGPHGDCGLTGRKIIVDTYGGMGRHGGGAFSGKDPSKVDRSAAYFARYIAKNIVAAKLARRCEVQLAYAIGIARPVSMYVDTFGTGIIPDEKLSALVSENFDARPKQIIETLNLLKPIYRRIAAYGHFGFNAAHLSWEDTSRAAELRHKAEAL